MPEISKQLTEYLLAGYTLCTRCMQTTWIILLNISRHSVSEHKNRTRPKRSCCHETLHLPQQKLAGLNHHFLSIGTINICGGGYQPRYGSLCASHMTQTWVCKKPCLRGCSSRLTRGYMHTSPCHKPVPAKFSSRHRVTMQKVLMAANHTFCQVTFVRKGCSPRGTCLDTTPSNCTRPTWSGASVDRETLARPSRGSTG